jgi:cytochrome c oxidase subunit 2
MKLASLGTAVLLALTLALAPGAHAQEAQAPEAAAPEVDTQPTTEGAIDVPSDVQPGVPVEPGDVVDEQPDARGVGAETEEPAGARWGNLPELPLVGVPVPGGIGFQPASSELTARTHALANGVDIVMVLIVLFVMSLIAITIVRFNRRANPEPARFTHNTRVEIAWTLVPVLILIGIGSFSLPVLFNQLDIPEEGMTVKITGHQWFWSVEYPDNEFSYEMFMLQPDELEPAGYDPSLFRLATDTALVVPVDSVVKVQMTAADVIHAFAMPAFGLKLDAIPGRLNELWFNPTREGVYFGQCSELCGLDHAFMPITMKVVSQEDYAAWLDWAIEEYGGVRPEAEVARAD